MMTLAFAFLLLMSAEGQEQGQTLPPTLRIEQIEAEQAKKSAELKPETPGSIEKRFTGVQDVIRRIFQRGPVHLRIGGLPPGAGLAIGPAFDWRNGNDEVRFDLSAAGSFKSFYTTRAALIFPAIVRNELSLEFEASHLDAPSLDYYGSGPESSKDGLTNFRKEDTHADFRLQWRPQSGRIAAGLQIGALFVNTGPGTDSASPSTDSVYGPAGVPGVDVQSNFLVAGYSLDFDSRDLPGDPHRGTHAIFQYRHYADIKRDRYSFARFAVSAEHYLPFFNEKRVIALRTRAELSYRSRDQAVPFFLQPTLGGGTDLRGFGLYRFADENLLLFNAEYRWEVNSGIDAALFGDAGKVFASPRQISLTHLETGGGFGLRFKTRTKVVIRIDNGISREGYQLWLKFNNVF